MNYNHVPLDRRFSVVPRSANDSDEVEYYDFLGNCNSKKWLEIERRFRTVILAEAGAGKTVEMRTRANFIRSQNRLAFFIHIEDVEDNFEQAFEVGSAIEFENWLDSGEDAWFFLDSVDEARLSDPRKFEKAIRQFAARIGMAELRAHICISSRPYAWRPKSDSELIELYLNCKNSHAKRIDESLDSTGLSVQLESELGVFKLNPLNEADIRTFAEHRSVSDVDLLIDELKRSNAMSMAERPFDLEGVLVKWNICGMLGGRSELLLHNIEQRLKELSPNTESRRSMSLNQLRNGARQIAAAVILCGKSGIQVPENTYEQMALDAKTVLCKWNESEVQFLLERAIFNDVIYGAVRFRHREICEFLAAEWFGELLQMGNSRHSIESLFFRNQYGERIISRRLRSILPWLILKDDKIRRRVLTVAPTIALEGGDPACLQLPDRKKILDEVLKKIILENKMSISHDSSALVGFAQDDLIDEVFELLKKHIDHDGAICFLGRLAWQGNMSKCVPQLLCVANDPARDPYVRIVAARSVMSLGTEKQRSRFWDSLLAAQAEIPRELLAELLGHHSTKRNDVALLLKAIEKLQSYNRFRVTGLSHALHGYIERVPTLDSDSVQPLTDFVCGAKKYLIRPPLIQRFSSLVSEEFIWLLNPVIHAIERLVFTHVDAVMQDDVLDILIMSDVREFLDEQHDDYRDNLSELIPAWPELNDMLFWRMVQETRTYIEENGGRLNDISHVMRPICYWSFDSDSFPRILGWLQSRELEDDRLLALSLAFRVLKKSRRQNELLQLLHATVAGDTTLTVRLNELLCPIMSEQEITRQRQELHRSQARKLACQERERKRTELIDRLKANPDLIRNPSGLNSAGVSSDQVSLMHETEHGYTQTKLAIGTNWESLIDEFGEAVACAYRDAAMDHWRHYDPGLLLEGGEIESLSFGLTGLEIEARVREEFPAHLNELEVKHALRYTTRESSGFPSWLKRMFWHKPQAVINVIQTEIFWDLDSTNSGKFSLRILHDLALYADWLHDKLLTPLQVWLLASHIPSDDSLRYCLHILKNGDIDPCRLAKLAQTKIGITQNYDLLPFWYALWVDTQPDSGILALSEWLKGLDIDQCSHAAQKFSVALLDNGYTAAISPRFGKYQTAEHLKALYVLMHTYVRVEDDIDRAGTGVHSPELRDYAQEARDKIFELLSKTSGKETYVALKELAFQHPNPSRRSWMVEQSYKYAEKEGDLESWTAAQVGEFYEQQTITPKNPAPTIRSCGLSTN